MSEKNHITESNPEWERLYAVILWAEMNPNSFAKQLGYPKAETLYRIKRGLNGISRNLADRIVLSFPNISKGWLLSGEGSMLRGDNI